MCCHARSCGGTALLCRAVSVAIKPHLHYAAGVPHSLHRGLPLVVSPCHQGSRIRCLVPAWRACRPCCTGTMASIPHFPMPSIYTHKIVHSIAAMPGNPEAFALPDAVVLADEGLHRRGGAFRDFPHQGRPQRGHRGQRGQHLHAPHGCCGPPRPGVPEPLLRHQHPAMPASGRDLPGATPPTHPTPCDASFRLSVSRCNLSYAPNTLRCQLQAKCFQVQAHLCSQHAAMPASD